MSPPRVDAGQRREVILEAALRLFGSYGYRRTSMDDIAREADLAKGTIYLSFASKDEVFRALAESLAGRMLAGAKAAARQSGPAEDRLAAMSAAWFGTYAEAVQQSPHASELLDAKHRLSADLVARALATFRRLVADVIGEAAAAGELRLADYGLSADAAAGMLIDAARGLQDDAAAPAASRRRLDTLVRVLTAGLRYGIPELGRTGAAVRVPGCGG